MFTPLWFVSVIALLVVDVRTGALQQKDYKSQRCYLCPASNNTCDHTSALQIIECPASRPHCATIAAAPNFTSTLQCAAATEAPCSLEYTAQKHKLTCICADRLCNAPFTSELLNELRNFSTSNVPNNNSADLTEEFFKMYSLVNFTDKNLYKLITVENSEATERSSYNSSHLTTVSATTIHTVTRTNEIEIPRAEARKQEATAPSDDDEDESEGSGSYDETRSQKTPSAPAAPSSFLPANENKSSLLYTKLFLSITFFVYFIV
ncbi:uncharacterized protein ACR2FA_004704 [Aphomia sociella]